MEHKKETLYFFLRCFYGFDYQAANDCDLEPVAYEFFTQAYILYEEEISVLANLSYTIEIHQIDWLVWKVFSLTHPLDMFSHCLISLLW